MDRTITSARATIRAIFTVTAYIVAAASIGTALAAVSEARAVTLAMGG